MLALEQIEAETDQTSGLPMSVVTDPKNAFQFVSKVTTNFAADTLARDQKTYYAQQDVDKDHPVIREGHMWSVRLRDPKPE